MRWIVTQLGAREHYAVPLAFHQLGHLRLFYTEAWCRWGRCLFQTGPSMLRSYGNRYHPGLPSNLVKSFTPSYAAFHLYHRPARHCTHAAIHYFYLKAGTWFGNAVAQHLSRQALDPAEDYLFAFNTGALEPLRMMRARGGFTVLDQIDPGPEHERLIAQERQKWPGWEDAVDRVPEEYWDRIRREWQVADLVLVNSEWSRKLLLLDGVPESKIIVVPLAYEPPPDAAIARTWEGQLTVLWVGNVTLAKGIQYLIEAAKSLPNVRFLVAGSIHIRGDKLRSAPPNMVFLGRIQRDQLGHLYKAAHLFVLPTISDGFGITQLEAMARGLPVIVTPNCGQVVMHEINGLLIPAGNSEALAAAIARLESNRRELETMSECAANRAAQFGLIPYAEQIEAVVRHAKATLRSKGATAA